MKLSKALGTLLAITALLVPIALAMEPAYAAPSLQEIQRQVAQLQDEASDAHEGSLAAKVQLAQLTRTLTGIRQQAAVQGETVAQLRKSLGVIAVEQYKSGGLSQGLELLFSSDPTLYLSAAGSLDSITRRKSMQLRAYATAQQRLNATTLTVNDKLVLVRATQARFTAQAAKAQSKLRQAEKIVAKLKKSDRARLAKLVKQENDKDQVSSLAFAKQAKAGSGRAGIALKFALAQIGDIYVFGGAGMEYWDCSGLTMKAYKAAGVSLPHSAAAQANYGKKVSFNDLRPGDLVFFGNPISHNGMYIGGGRMVNAPRTGQRVKIASFGAYFGKLRFVAARRL